VTFETRFGLVKPAVAIDLAVEVTSLAERHLAGPARRELATEDRPALALRAG
jgi:hypothetical protein